MNNYKWFIVTVWFNKQNLYISHYYKYCNLLNLYQIYKKIYQFIIKLIINNSANKTAVHLSYNVYYVNFYKRDKKEYV